MKNFIKWQTPSEMLKIWTFVLLIAVAGILTIVPDDAHADVATYTPTQDIISNPERGLYYHPGNCSSSLPETDIWEGTNLSKKIHEKDMKLVLCLFYLDRHNAQATVPQTLSAAEIKLLDDRLKKIRNSGAKAILRFAYFDCSVAEHSTRRCDAARSNDAPISTIEKHLDQLGPTIRKWQDGILVMEAGFVGKWGEWNTSVSDGDWAGRSRIVRKMQGFLPDRMIQVRTPVIKSNLTGIVANRVGYHVDCFLANPHDGGTFVNPPSNNPNAPTVEQQRTALANDTLNVAMGGETCLFDDYPPRAMCPLSPQELQRVHFSYLNGVGHPTVIDGWNNGGCMPDIKRGLGYRFSLTSSEIPSSVPTGATTINFKFSVTNTGWASTLNKRPVYLILRKPGPVELERGLVRDAFAYLLNTDTRQWKPGTTVAVNVNVLLNFSTAGGPYNVYLWFPDPEMEMAAWTGNGMAIRLANRGADNRDVWEPEMDFNRLSHTVTFRTPAPASTVSPFFPVATPSQGAALK